MLLEHICLYSIYMYTWVYWSITYLYFLNSKTRLSHRLTKNLIKQLYLSNHFTMSWFHQFQTSWPGSGHSLRWMELSILKMNSWTDILHANKSLNRIKKYWYYSYNGIWELNAEGRTPVSCNILVYGQCLYWRVYRNIVKYLYGMGGFGDEASHLVDTHPTALPMSRCLLTSWWDIPISMVRLVVS